MLSLSPSIRIFVHIGPTDMRKQFNGLHSIVTHALKQDIMTGDYFVFFNRLRHRCNILYWDLQDQCGPGNHRLPTPDSNRHW